MQLQKSDKGNFCAFCKQPADFITDGEKPIALCKNCALEMYKLLAKEFVPQSIPNLIKKAEDKNKATIVEGGNEIIQKENQPKSNFTQNEDIDTFQQEEESTSISAVETAVKTGGAIAKILLKIIEFFKHLFHI